MKTLRWVHVERKGLTKAQRRTVAITDMRKHDGCMICHLCKGAINAKIEKWQVNEVAQVEADEDAPAEGEEGFEAWEAEHVTPLGLGGSDDIENLRPAHVKCHKAKTTTDRTAMAKSDHVKDRDMGVHVARKPMRGGRADQLKMKVGGGTAAREERRQVIRPSRLLQQWGSA